MYTSSTTNNQANAQIRKTLAMDNRNISIAMDNSKAMDNINSHGQ